SSSAVSALTSGQASPLSLASGDFYQDGIASLVVGYAAAGGGVLTLHRGNLDAFAPQSTQSWQAIGQGQYPPPFLGTATAYQAPTAPDFLVTGEFAGSDHTDLVMASRAGGSLYVFPGDGHGNLGSPQAIALPGPVTALAAGRFGSPSSFTSL